MASLPVKSQEFVGLRAFSQQRLTGQVLRPRSPSLVRDEAPFDGLVSVLCRHAQERTEQPAFVELRDGQTDGTILTYAQLDRRARAIGAQLLAMGLTGQRVVLAYPYGVDFILGFFGCLYAGCTAVPTYLPHRRTLGRFHAITADADARVALSTATAAAQFQVMVGQ